MSEKSELVSWDGPVSELKGKEFPEIPTSPEVDMESIREANPNPVFVTLPIAEIGLKSAAGILYDEALLDAIQQQIVSKRSGGIMGHVAEQDKEHSFPIPKAFWVGAQRVGSVLWGKAWVRDAETASYIRDLKRVNGQIGTSIWGRGVHEKSKDGVTRLRNFVLESLDFAPPERASLAMQRQFALTAEMNDGQQEEGNEMTIQEQLAGMNGSAIAEMLNPAQITEVANCVALKLNKAIVDVATVSEMTTTTTRVAELVSQVAEKDAQIAQLRQEQYHSRVQSAVNSATDWVVADDASKEKLAGLRTVLKSALVAEMAVKPEATPEDAMASVMEMHKIVVETVRDSLSGGRGTSGATNNRSSGFELPTAEQIAEARARTGF